MILSSKLGVSLKKKESRFAVQAQFLSFLVVFGLLALVSKGEILSADSLKVMLNLLAIPLLLALALHFSILQGGIDLSCEGIISLSAILFGFLVNTSLSALFVVVLVLLHGFFWGLLNGFLHARLRIPSLITTLGVGWLAKGLAVALSQGSSLRLLDAGYQKFSNSFFILPSALWLSLFVLFVIVFLQKKSLWGRYLYVVGAEESLAGQLGINVKLIKLFFFGCAAALYAAVAILLVARLGSFNSRLGENLLFPAITAVAVGGIPLSGGMGSGWNVFFGALIVVILNHGLVIIGVNSYLQDFLNGLILLLAVALTLDRSKFVWIK